MSSKWDKVAKYLAERVKEPVRIHVNDEYPRRLGMFHSDGDGIAFIASNVFLERLLGCKHSFIHGRAVWLES